MSADTYPHPGMKGPTGTFELLGCVEQMTESLPGDFSLLVCGGRQGKFFLALSIAEGDLTPLTAQFIGVGTPVYSQVKAPANSEPMRDYNAGVYNNRIFLTSRPE